MLFEIDEHATVSMPSQPVPLFQEIHLRQRRKAVGRHHHLLTENFVSIENLMIEKNFFFNIYPFPAMCRSKPKDWLSVALDTVAVRLRLSGSMWLPLERKRRRKH